ncbi:zinc ABC transporter substrate-binding protein [Geomonas sp. RF6]|uniref:metal ABC transporter solute-binding protein, Zn/Mn family n=1 Tax=Geomonas sp. RF6 TaxID=2897342 RepID=UPI001E635960|nr:zinc ABC transporter substrate-binding protein [Geomonas sp. RF6]UFS69943.1 zinc ABC transporter substrate-binding protein [Geomonas sp. RF6]
MKRTILVMILLILCIACTVGCTKKEAAAPASGAKKLTVITTLFPLYDFTRQIAGDRADVVMLLPPGIEPHSFEPKPNDIVRLNKADVIIYTNEYMEPWAAKLVGTLSHDPAIIDSSIGVNFLKGDGGAVDAHQHGAAPEHDGGVDPHIWLDFGNAQIMVDNIAKGLVAKDPANREYYQTHAAGLKEELRKLDDEYRSGLANCRKKIFLEGGHFAFGYLAARYHLTYKSAQALNPDAEPTPDKLAALVRLMKENRLHYVFTEELLSPATAEMIARETGAKVLTLNASHNISRDDLEKGVGFVPLMKKNLESLRLGLECQ